MLAQCFGGVACALAGFVAYEVRGRSATLLGPSRWKGVSDRASIALTFDDGPSESTPELLEVLAQHAVKATFFQCGMHVRRLPAVSREVAGAGHEIGNHSDTHAPLYFRSRAAIYRELAHAQESILEASGSTPALFRAPYGARWFGLRDAQRKLGLSGVMWTAIGRDWTLPAEHVVRRLLRAARNGAIFCLHDGRAARTKPDIRPSIEAVRRLVPALQDKGYHFETVSQILCPMN